nr:uroporphyrinogen-III synthase [Roseicella aerolata]
MVTRPRPQAGELVARLRAGGMRCLVEPMLEIMPLPWEAGAALHRRQAILLTSPNGAEALLRATGITGEGLAGLPPILAVGAATARPLWQAGLAGVEAADGTARNLLRLVQARLDPHSGPIAYLSAETVACDLATALAPEGFVVERSIVYSAQPPARLSPRARDAISGGAIQVVPFLSARAAAAFRHLLAQEGLEATCRGMVGIALSQRIAAAMAPLPWRMLETAGRPDLDGLLAALYRSLASVVDETFPQPTAPH